MWNSDISRTMSSDSNAYLSSHNTVNLRGPIIGGVKETEACLGGKQTLSTHGAWIYDTLASKRTMEIPTAMTRSRFDRNSGGQKAMTKTKEEKKD